MLGRPRFRSSDDDDDDEGGDGGDGDEISSFASSTYSL